MPGLRIAIDARLTPRAPGGVLQVVLGLTHGLTKLTDSNERFSFLVNADYDGWLDGYLGGNCELLRMKRSSSIARVRHRLNPRAGVPKSDGTIERHGFNGVHFLLPIGFRTRLPSVYQIHDLQHLHYPEYFQRRTLRLRETVFPTLCREARRIFTMTNWGKQDAIDRLGLEAEKVCVVPWGSVLNAYSRPSRTKLDQVRRKLGLTEPFAFFPAKAYPHKNHVCLLRAVACARDQNGVRIPLVFSGAEGAATPSIQSEVDRLGLSDQVRHVGFVDPDVVTCLFQLCQCLVFPSLFEGWGLPITEALSLQKPIVCARATCLPEVAGDAAAYFDPRKVDSIAHQLVRVWTDRDWRQRLQDRAKHVAGSLTWENTARQFRAHYRELFGQPQQAKHAA